MKTVSSVTALFLLFSHHAFCQTPFNPDSAAVYLRTIAVEIGPRPMGSPGERRAMEFALTKFRQFGLDDAYLMPMRTATSHTAGGTVNTNSGVAVGVLRGKSQRIIVLGAHIDSAGPEIPGANDDGSGTAVVMELARILARKEMESTIVFALFGGEEEGLQGSRYFVEKFPAIDSIALMIQVDMANGSEWLLPLIDSREYTTPRWLVAAAYDELRSLGYRGFSYPTHFMSLNAFFGSGAITSDHLPFLERSIPAIDFTSDVNDPIHTPQDSYENFNIAGLKRSGDLVYRLVERFDAGVPHTDPERFLLVDVFMHPIFIPYWLLTLVVLLALTITGVALWQMHARYKLLDRSVLPRWSATKLFFFMLIIQTCVWLSENVVGLIGGVRFPWMADLNGYIALGFVAATVGIWISLQLARKLQLTVDAFAYFLRAAVVFVFLILLLSLVSVRVAVYPAVGLLFVSLAMLVRQPVVRVLLWLLSPHMMYRLIFSEGFELMARSLAMAPARDRTAGVVLHGIYILFFSFWAYPFLLSFAALYRDSKLDLLWLKRFSNRRGLIAAMGTFVLLVAYLSSRPSYDHRWRPSMLIHQANDYEKGESIISISSTEYFRDLTLQIEGWGRVFSGWSTEAVIHRPLPLTRWVDVSHQIETTGDSLRHMSVRSTLRFSRQPLLVVIRYATAHGSLSNFFSSHEASVSARSATIRWYSFPDTVLRVVDGFNVSSQDTVFQSVEVIFAEGMEIMVQKGFEGNIASRRIERLQTVLE